MTIASLSEQTAALDGEIRRIANKVDELVTQANTNVTAIAAVNTKLTNLTDPVTITISTLTMSAVNTALETAETQLKTIIAALKA